MYVAKPPLYPPPHSTAMDLGTVAHAGLLDAAGIGGIAREIPPHVLDTRGARRGGAWNEWAAQWPPEMILLKREEYDLVSTMMRSVQSHPEAAPLLNRRRSTEHTAIWEADGIACRARPDLLSAHDGDGALIVDLKFWTVSDEAEIIRAIGRFATAQQLAWYWEGMEAADWLIAGNRLIVCQTKAPFQTWVGWLPRDEIEDARSEARAFRRELAWRRAQNDWDDKGAQTLRTWRTPEWARTPVTVSVGGKQLTI